MTQPYLWVESHRPKKYQSVTIFNKKILKKCELNFCNLQKVQKRAHCFRTLKGLRMKKSILQTKSMVIRFFLNQKNPLTNNFSNVKEKRFKSQEFRLFYQAKKDKRVTVTLFLGEVDMTMREQN